MHLEPSACFVLTLLVLLTVLPLPLAAQDGCFTCDTETKNCKEAAKLGFTECSDGTWCGAAGCIEICIAGPVTCAEIVPVDPPELRTSPALLACGHGQSFAPANSDTLVACQTPNGSPAGSCLRAMG